MDLPYGNASDINKFIWQLNINKVKRADGVSAIFVKITFEINDWHCSIPLMMYLKTNILKIFMLTETLRPVFQNGGTKIKNNPPVS